MKKTQLKDAWRNIIKQIVSYLSIVVIAALGVVMFLGIDYSASAMRKNGSAYFNSANFRDIEVISTLMLSGEDMDVLRGIEGVRDVEGVMQIGIKIFSGGSAEDAYAVTMTERINIPEVIEGRLPENDDECAVEQKLLGQLGLKVGDKISVRISAKEFSVYLSKKEFRITGVVIHPDHVSTSAPDAPYIMVRRSLFDLEALGSSFMRADIVIDKPENINRFEKEYKEMTDRVVERIEACASSRAALRDAEVRTMAQEYLDGNRQTLDEAWEKLQEARRQLDEGWAEYNQGTEALTEGERKLSEARQQLDDAKAQLEDGAAVLADSRAELDDAKAQLDDAKAQLDAGKAELDSAKRQLRSGWDELENAKEQIRNAIRERIDRIIHGDSSEFINWAAVREANVDSADASARLLPITENFSVDLGVPLKDRIRNLVEWIDIPEKYLAAAFEYLGGEGEYNSGTAKDLIVSELLSLADTYLDDYNKLNEACLKWDDGHEQYLSGKEQFKSALSKYNDALAKYGEGESLYAEGLRKYEDGLREYEDGEKQYSDGVIELENARMQLEEGFAKLTDGETEYAKGLEEYYETEGKLEKAERVVEGVDKCKWITLDTYGNTSFVQYSFSAENLKSLEMTFSLLFVLVGALVIYATISKMVDEQRSLVGTTKALGFYNREILAKYLIFGVSATLLGSVLGLIVARLFVEGFILHGYGNYYLLNMNKPTVELLPTVTVFLAAALLAVAAIWFACSRLLKTPAVQLMQQATPKGRKKSGAGSGKGLSLYSRLILLNMRTDLKRVVVTIISVAGCCTLVVIGFTLQYAVKGSVRHQFTDVVQYDGIVKYDRYRGGEVADEIGEALKSAGAEYVQMMNTYVTVRINRIEMNELYCGDLSGMGGMFRLKDVKTGQSLAPSDEGIFVPKRFSEVNKLSVGDHVKIALNGTEEVDTVIAGVFNNYMARAMFMSSEYYRKLFSREFEPNAFFVRLDGADEKALIETLNGIDGYETWAPSDTAKKLFDSATKVMNAIVLLFILMAAIMAGVVLMNLTNIYIMQKKRELTIMRVNGFTVKEVISYVLRETVITTVSGIVLGVGLGSLMAYLIVRALEQPFIQYDRSVSIAAWLAGAAITIGFTVIVNLIALRKVKDLKLTDAA